MGRGSSSRSLRTCAARHRGRERAMQLLASVADVVSKSQQDKAANEVCVDSGDKLARHRAEAAAFTTWSSQGAETMRYSQVEALPAIVHPARAGVASWLEQQAASRRYDWNLSHRCLLALYLHEACGIADPIKAFPDGYERLVGPDYYRIAQREPWTCGAALRRMRALGDLA